MESDKAQRGTFSLTALPPGAEAGTGTGAEDKGASRGNSKAASPTGSDAARVDGLMPQPSPLVSQSKTRPREPQTEKRTRASGGRRKRPGRKLITMSSPRPTKSSLALAAFRAAQSGGVETVTREGEDVTLKCTANLEERLDEITKHDIEEATKMTQRLRKKCDWYQSKIRDKKTSIERIQKELDAMRSATKVKNQDRSGLGRRAKNLQKTIDELDEEYSIVEHKAAIYGHMRKRLIRENKAVDRQLTQMQGELSQVQKKYEEALAQHHKLKQAHADLQRQSTHLHQQLDLARDRQHAELLKIDRVIRESRMQNAAIRGEVETSDKTALQLQRKETKMKKMLITKRMQNDIVSKQLSEETERMDNLEKAFAKIKNTTGLTDVNEIVTKFLTRDQTYESLLKSSEAASRQIENLKQQQAELQRQLADFQGSAMSASGNRELYREVDAYDLKLSEAQRQCRDANKRAVRMRVLLEEARTSVALHSHSRQCAAGQSGCFFAAFNNADLGLDFKARGRIAAAAAAKDAASSAGGGPSGTGGSGGGSGGGGGGGSSSLQQGDKADGSSANSKEGGGQGASGNAASQGTNAGGHARRSMEDLPQSLTVVRQKVQILLRNLAQMLGTDSTTAAIGKTAQAQGLKVSPSSPSTPRAVDTTASPASPFSPSAQTGAIDPQPEAALRRSSILDTPKADRLIFESLMHAEADISSKNMRVKRSKMNSTADESAVAHLLGIETAVLHDEFDDHSDDEDHVSDDGDDSRIGEHSDGDGSSKFQMPWYDDDGSRFSTEMGAASARDNPGELFDRTAIKKVSRCT